ncbi:hypothetical protein HRbin30_02457 [bacterium HR30]|nr:hypothetical protein HRbin30_02457 [bacterium HR30]
MKFRKKLFLLGVALALGWGSASRAVASGGLAWEAKITTEEGSVQTMRVVTVPQKFKIQHQSGNEYLVRLDRGEVYFIDPQKRAYQRVKLAELENAAKTARAQMQAALGHMQKELEALPPAQRRLLEQMVAEQQGARPAKPKVRKTGERKTIAGYPCTEYVVEAEGKVLLTACTTEQIAAFQSMRQDWLTAQKQLGKMNPFGGGNLRDVLAEVPGFPLETKMSGVHALVTKVDTNAPALSEFEVPAGFELRPGPPLPQ